jgi:negative regulator of flagellin synthesis FlgM
MSGVRKTSGATGPVAPYGPAPQRGPAAPAAKAGRGDSSGITSAARELGRALHAVEEIDEVRSERVAALRAQIASGTYRPDPREIAKKLLERGL